MATEKASNFKTLTVRLPKSLVEVLSETARRTGIPKSTLVSRALATLLDPEKMHEVEQAVAALERAFGSQDVLNRIAKNGASRGSVPDGQATGSQQIAD